jgi:hypothetical protein
MYKSGIDTMNAINVISSKAGQVHSQSESYCIDMSVVFTQSILDMQEQKMLGQSQPKLYH